MTPQTAVGAPEDDPLERLFAVAAEVDAPLAAIARTVEHAVACWRRTGELPEHRPGLLAEVVEVLESLDGPERALEHASPLSPDVSVVGFDAMDALQRSIVSDEARRVDGLADEPGETVTLEMASNRDTAVAHAVVSLEAPERSAIVVDREGPYWRRLLARLRAEGMVLDTSATTASAMAFCNLLRHVLRPGTPTVAAARPTLDALGVHPTQDERSRPVERLTDERATWLGAVTDSSAELRVETLLAQFAFRTGSDVSWLERTIDHLGVGDDVPTPRVVADLEWLVEWTERQARRGGDTPRLVDPQAATFVDREHVTFLGVSPDWFQEVESDNRQRARLGWLCSSGASRRWIVSESDGDPRRLKAALGELAVEHVEPTRPGDGFVFEPERRPPRGHDRLTKTVLNNLLRSPRDALFAGLDDTHASPGLTRGTAIHEYAELRLGAPAALDALGRERAIDLVLEEVLSLFAPHRRAIEAARINASIAVVDRYLESVEPDGDGIETFTAPDWRENRLADQLELAPISAIAEQYFVGETLGISGLVDLILSETHIVDFKTGSPRPVSTLVNRGRVDPPGSHTDTQLPMYLVALRRRRPNRSLRFSYVYCDGQQPAALAGVPDVQVASRTVEYRPRARLDDLLARSTIEALGADVPEAHPRRHLLSAVDHGAIVDILASSGWRPGESSRAVLDGIATLGEDEGLDGPLARAGVRSLLVGMDDRVDRHLYEDDLNAFERFLDHWSDRRATFDRNGYPLGDPAEGWLHHPTMHHDLAPVRSGGGGE